MSNDDWQPGDISKPDKAIRTFCWECLGGETPVEECSAIDCPLFPHRLGKAAKAAIRESERVRRLAGRTAGPVRTKAKSKDQSAGLFKEEEPEEGATSLFELEPEEDQES